MARICMVVYAQYPEDTRVRREAEALAARGDSVDVVCLRAATPGTRIFNGVRIFPVAAAKYSGGSGLAYLASYLTFFVGASVRLAALHLRRRYHVIQVHTMPDFLVFTALFPRLLGARVLLDVHDLMPELYQSKYSLPADHPAVRLLTWMERCSVCFADAAIAVHQPHLDVLVQHGNPRGKFIILMNLPDPALFGAGIDPSAFSVQRSPSTAAPLRLIYHGTISRRHGLDVALAALARLRNEGCDVRLRITGVGDDLPHLREQAGVLRLDGAVNFQEGWVRIDELLPVIRQADAGVVPILYDRFTRIMLPGKLLEYAAVGIPAICSRTETIEAYFDDSMVCYFRPGDVDDLAAKMRELYFHPEQRARLAAGAQRFFQQHPWDAQVQRYTQLIDRLALAGQPAKGSTL
jgi:glycosyltransferase involved in cell wall biosynthesis